MNKKGKVCTACNLQIKSLNKNNNEMCDDCISFINGEFIKHTMTPGQRQVLESLCRIYDMTPKEVMIEQTLDWMRRRAEVYATNQAPACLYNTILRECYENIK